MRVLYVDHSKTFRTIWQRMMLGAGYEVLVLSSGEEALDWLKSNRVDLVCLSHSLPDTNGIELTRALRQLNTCRRIPILLLTNQKRAELHRAAFEAGVTDICIRTSMSELFERVLRLANQRTRLLDGRVLYVEDSKTVSRIMIALLESMGLTADHFTRADEALRHYDPDQHDLVISDLLVEGELSGIALVNELRQRHPDPVKLPILAMSGMDDDARRVELFRLGANDFISKPVIPEEAAARIRNLIVQKQLFDQVQRQQAQLYHMAMTDPLTGLFNRHSLDEMGRKYTSAANRHEEDLSLIAIDLDHFKQINDVHGHLAGDKVLASVAELLRQSCREQDFAVRMGGEEMLLILPGCSLDHAEQRAEQLRSDIAKLKPAGINVTGSIGVTSRPVGRTITLMALINQADKAVYAAKESGRNTVVSSVIDWTTLPARPSSDSVTALAS